MNNVNELGVVDVQDSAAQPLAEIAILTEETHEPAPLPQISHTVQSTGRAGGQISYRQVSEIEARPINWLWPGYIAKGKVSILAGHPGLGKSQVTIKLAATVSTGGSWPVDGLRCEPSNVIMLTAEDDAEDTIRPRLEAAGANLDRVFILDKVPSPDPGDPPEPFNLKTGMSHLEAMLEQITGAELIIIDPVSAFLGGAGGNNNNAAVRALLSPLSDLAARHGTAVILVNHLTKAKTAKGEKLLRVLGSVGFVAAARTVLLVERDRYNGSRRLLLPVKNNIGNDQIGFAFSVHPAQVETPRGPVQTSRIEWEPNAVGMPNYEELDEESEADPGEPCERDNAKAFLHELLANGPISSKEVQAKASNAGFSWRTIVRAQKSIGIKAVKDGLKGWKWQLPSPPDTETGQEIPKNGKQRGWQPSMSSDRVEMELEEQET